MTRDQLLSVLLNEGIPADAVDLTGGHESETYTLAQRGRDWVVYYSERGLESGIKKFTTESDACIYLLSLIRCDHNFEAKRSTFNGI